MGFGSCCAKCILIFFNVLFMILAILLITIGAFLLGFQDVIQNNLPINLKDTFEEVLNAITGDKSNAEAAQELVDQFFGLFMSLGVAILMIGLLIFVLTILASCGSCCMVKCMLIGYIVLLVVVILVQAICLGLYGTDKLDAPIKKSSLKSLKEKYEGNKGDNLESIMLNLVQYQFECCGINNVTDFDDVDNWDKSEGYEHNGQTYVVEVELPTTCCKMTGIFPDDVILQDQNCPTAPTSVNSYMATGCYEAVKAEMKTFQVYILGFVGGCIALELLFVLLAALILYLQNKQKINPI
ncbi:hypothetical protein CAPTEDRAFT_216192 [Capitella teleta]|uniref:Tetraspanin n=1 Tax=Capitella teleta TaxID=283909 RepID=R7VAV1_CAPTE|nr:hypothetical protein CAPTEDRAFT_216192 [Capitella teleta]|eukprot:ELU13466.1 hypothetical protein CAPTEDRAFT_216192 [Capitella teleta]